MANMPTIAPQINAEPIRTRLLDEQYVWSNPNGGEPVACNGLEVARRIYATQGQNANRLRAAKPPMTESIITRNRYGHDNKYRDYPLAHCAGAQVWRYVAFEASPLSHHHCMPVMADFDCPFDMSNKEARRFAEWCQGVADIILSAIPDHDKHGLRRWAKALYG